MFKPCPLHFQIHRKNGMFSTPRRELSVYGTINIGKIAVLLNKILDETVIFPDIRNMFSLLCVEHRNGNACGFSDVKIEIPGTILRFHFTLDKNLVAYKVPVIRELVSKKNGVVANTRIVSNNVMFSDIDAKYGGGRILTIGFHVADLAGMEADTVRTIGQLELLYKIFGVTTKRNRIYHGDWFKGSNHFGTVLANNDPKDYHKSLLLWKVYPSLLPDLTLEACYYVLDNLQNFRSLTDSGNRVLSRSMREMLGITVSAVSRVSLIDFIEESMHEVLSGVEKRTNLSLDKCFANFEVPAASVLDLAKMLRGSDLSTVKQRIHTLIWSAT